MALAVVNGTIPGLADAISPFDWVYWFLYAILATAIITVGGLRASGIMYRWGMRLLVLCSDEDEKDQLLALWRDEERPARDILYAMGPAVKMKELHIPPKNKQEAAQAESLVSPPTPRPTTEPTVELECVEIG
jgi:hypothetical protein